MSALKSMSSFEKILWLVSVLAIIVSSLITGNKHLLTIIASLTGVTALIFVAKGNTIGQILTVFFSILYSIISWDYHYYGEMITYLGMTAPIAVLSVISWLKNPYNKGVNQVKIARLTKKGTLTLAITTALVTFGFYFILKVFNTANLLISTVSIATSFLASALMLFRSSGYALAYAANDVVLITLWVLASRDNPMYYSMVVCFIIFLCNDLYGFYNWERIKAKQAL